MNTPRPPCGLYHVDGKLRVLENETRVDRTYEYTFGAEKCMEMCDSLGIWAGVLKRRSPSCGIDKTYIDGVVQEG